LVYSSPRFPTDFIPISGESLVIADRNVAEEARRSSDRERIFELDTFRINSIAVFIAVGFVTFVSADDDVFDVDIFVSAFDQFVRSRKLAESGYLAESRAGRRFIEYEPSRDPKPRSWTGSLGWSKARFHHWMERFEWISTVTALEKKTRAVAKEAAEIMRQIEEATK
jgi:hypothetical protein